MFCVSDTRSCDFHVSYSLGMRQAYREKDAPLGWMFSSFTNLGVSSVLDKYMRSCQRNASWQEVNFGAWVLFPAPCIKAIKFIKEIDKNIS